MLPHLRHLLASLAICGLAVGAEPVPAPGEPVVIVSGQVDPAALAAMTAPPVPWEAGDRLALVGDLLSTPNQPELAIRMQEALTAARPGLDLTVRGVQNHGLPLRTWQEALGNELSRRQPNVVLICAGLGDVQAALAAKGAPPTADAWKSTLLDMVRAAQMAGAAVVVATPAVLGDKPADGPGFKDLEGYADAARAVATETKSELCDIRQALIAHLTEKNGKGTRDLGILSKAQGQLKPAAMDLVAGLMAKSIAAAVARIPWTVSVPNTPFSGSAKAEVRLGHATPAQVNLYVTTDGTEPSEKSPSYMRPIPVAATTRIRVLAVSKDGTVRRTADGWYMEAKKRASEARPPETLPGLWIDHYTFKRWRNPIPPLDTLKPDYETWAQNIELGAVGRVPNHRWPNTLFGLRFTGYFIAPVDGIYIFATNSDDASRLSIGDTIVVRNDELHAAAWAYGAVELNRGFHQLNLQYGQGPGLIALEVFVALPGQRLQPLPDILLRRPIEKPARKGPMLEVDDGPDPEPGK